MKITIYTPGQVLVNKDVHCSREELVSELKKKRALTLTGPEKTTVIPNELKRNSIFVLEENSL